MCTINETKDVELLETPEAPTENVPPLVASTKLVDRPAAETALTETPTSEVPSSIEVDTAEHTTTGHVLIETIQGETASSKVTIIISMSAGNYWSILNAANVFQICCKL